MSRGETPSGSSVSSKVRRQRWRATEYPRLTGTVLDVGAGDGQSEAHLPPGAEWIAVEPDPSDELRRAVQRHPKARLIEGPGERIPLADNSADAAILCTVLCSVSQPSVVLEEVKRILKPGGRLVFFEHVGAPSGTWTRLVQRVYRPFGKRFDAGCDPTRDLESVIRSAGFASVDVSRFAVRSVLWTTEPFIFGDATV